MGIQSIYNHLGNVDSHPYPSTLGLGARNLKVAPQLLYYFSKGFNENHLEIKPLSRQSTAWCIFELKPNKVKFHPNRDTKIAVSSMAKLHR